MAELEAEARRRWPLVGCAIVHRVGRVAVGEASVAIAVSSPHREDAFAAGKWLIDTLKQVVPIWKKENWADGSSQWVHPGLETNRRLATGDNRFRPRNEARAFPINAGLLPPSVCRNQQDRTARLCESHATNHDHLRTARRFLRPRAHEPADQRHGPLQHPLLLLHAARGRPVQAAPRTVDVRGDRTVRARGGSAGRTQAADHGRRTAGAQRIAEAGRASWPRCRASTIWR